MTIRHHISVLILLYKATLHNGVNHATRLSLKCFSKFVHGLSVNESPCQASANRKKLWR